MLRTAMTLSFVLTACGLSLVAQTSPAPAKTEQQVHADLNQLMRGVLYPTANVVFSAQIDNPAEIKIVRDPTLSTDPLTGAFGGWVAVENAALALAESANLMAIPGRRCANGVPVPTTDATWAMFVQQVRDGSMEAYKAAQAKNQDAIIEVSNKLSDACAGCHRRWRDRKTPDNRCK